MTSFLPLCHTEAGRQTDQGDQAIKNRLFRFDLIQNRLPVPWHVRIQRGQDDAANLCTQFAGAGTGTPTPTGMAWTELQHL